MEMRTLLRLQNFVFANAVMFTLLLASTLALNANATNSVGGAKSAGFVVQPPFIEPAVPQSTFGQPKRQAEGRDPFFPKSNRVYGMDPTPKPDTIPVPTAELTLKGISGTPEQPLAIINNMTFTAGEENDVTTRAGKIRIRCIEIKMSEGTVLVQVGGKSHALRLAPSK